MLDSQDMSKGGTAREGHGIYQLEGKELVSVGHGGGSTLAERELGHMSELCHQYIPP